MKPLARAEIAVIALSLLLILTAILYNPDPAAVRHAKEASYGETAKPEGHGK